tara:strand:+ start:305 stop:865 length:561 start_codon:yes stop_codon:yes gene_type:complete
MKVINRLYFARTLAAELDMTTQNCLKIVAVFIDVLSGALIEHKGIRLMGVGFLNVLKTKQRLGRDLVRGGQVTIPSRYAVRLNEGSNGNEYLLFPELFNRMTTALPEFSTKQYKVAYDVFLRLLESVVTGTNKVVLRGLGFFYPTFLKQKYVLDNLTGKYDRQVNNRIKISFSCSKILLAQVNTPK